VNISSINREKEGNAEEKGGLEAKGVHILVEEGEDLGLLSAGGKEGG